MAHVRQQIRSILLSELVGLPTTGANVTANRIYPYSIDQLPALNVVIESESRMEDDDTMGTDQVRELTLIIEGRAIGDSALDDTLDDMAAEVEQALAQSIELAGLVRYLNYNGSEIDILKDGEQLIGLVTLEYVVEYSVNFGQAQIAI